MYKLIQNGQLIKEYYTRTEADYYKKQYPHSKVITNYRIYDMNKGLMADDTIITASSPAEAIKKYIKENKLNIKVELDCSNTGRFVIIGNRTSKVYKEI